MTRKLGFAGERDRYWIAVDDLVRWGRPRWLPRWRLREFVANDPFDLKGGTMTIDNTRDPRGRLPVLEDDGPACDAEHWWSGWTCQADPGHPGPHRHYLDGGHAQWHEPRDAIRVDRAPEELL